MVCKVIASNNAWYYYSVCVMLYAFILLVVRYSPNTVAVNSVIHINIKSLRLCNTCVQGTYYYVYRIY